jgi:hypothetical protein
MIVNLLSFDLCFCGSVVRDLIESSGRRSRIGREGGLVVVYLYAFSGAAPKKETLAKEAGHDFGIISNIRRNK